MIPVFAILILFGEDDHRAPNRDDPLRSVVYSAPILPVLRVSLNFHRTAQVQVLHKPAVSYTLRRRQRMIKSILVATDGSAAANRAVDHAADMAAKYECSLSILNVIRIMQLPPGLLASA